MRAKTILIILLILLVIVTLSCTQNETEWRGTVEEKDGLTIVKNPKESMYGPGVCSMEEELTVGSKGSKSEIVFQNILPYKSIEVDKNDNIYVLDEKACQVLVFDKKGRFIKSIGSKGQGPGEMQSPSCIRIVSENEIMIYDYTNRHISFFTLDGNILKDISCAKLPGLFRPIPDSERNLIALIIIEKTMTIHKLNKFYPNSESILTIAQLEIPRVIQQETIYPYRPSIMYEVLEDDKCVWGY